MSPIAGNTDSFVKNSEHFIKLIQVTNLRNEDYLVSFYISLFTNMPVKEVNLNSLFYLKGKAIPVTGHGGP
jgi:hypothetical protein